MKSTFRLNIGSIFLMPKIVVVKPFVYFCYHLTDINKPSGLSLQQQKKNAVSQLKFLTVDHCDREEKERGGGRSFSDPLQVRIIFCGAFIFKFSKFQTREIVFQTRLGNQLVAFFIIHVPNNIYDQERKKLAKCRNYTPHGSENCFLPSDKIHNFDLCLVFLKVS